MAPSHHGGLSSKDDQATAKFYKDLYDMSHGTVANPQTPRKPKAVEKDSELLPVPYTEDADGDEV